jgi:hypothetical protein
LAFRVIGADADCSDWADQNGFLSVEIFAQSAISVMVNMVENPQRRKILHLYKSTEGPDAFQHVVDRYTNLQYPRPAGALFNVMCSTQALSVGFVAFVRF